jgi:hypothetical protein
VGISQFGQEIIRCTPISQATFRRFHITTRKTPKVGSFPRAPQRATTPGPTVPTATKKVKEPYCWFDPAVRFFMYKFCDYSAFNPSANASLIAGGKIGSNAKARVFCENLPCFLEIIQREHESAIRVPETPSTFHPHAQRNAFRRRDVRLQSRSFVHDCFTDYSGPLAAQVCSLQAGRSPSGFALPAL